MFEGRKPWVRRVERPVQTRSKYDLVIFVFRLGRYLSASHTKKKKSTSESRGALTIDAPYKIKV